MTDPFDEQINNLLRDTRTHRQRSDDAIDRMIAGGVNPTGRNVREAIDGAGAPMPAPPPDYPPPDYPYVRDGVCLRCGRKVEDSWGSKCWCAPLVRTGQGDTARDYNPPPTDPMLGVRVRCVALGLVVGFVAGVWIGGVL